MPVSRLGPAGIPRADLGADYSGKSEQVSVASGTEDRVMNPVMFRRISRRITRIGCLLILLVLA